MRWLKVPIEHLVYQSLSATDKIVYVALCAFANKDGTCYPRRSTLAEYTSLSTRSITGSIAKLCEFGIISQVLRSGTSALYRVECLARDSIPMNDVGVESDSIRNECDCVAVDSILSAEEVFYYFNECLPAHKVGNRIAAMRFISDNSRPRSWYTKLFEAVACSPFLCGLNARKTFFPLSFLLRESELIIEGKKYAPWQRAAHDAADFLKNGG